MILHAKRWDVYMNGKRSLIKDGNSVVVSGSDGNNVLWGVVDNNFVEEIN